LLLIRDDSGSGHIGIDPSSSTSSGRAETAGETALILADADVIAPPLLL
jgi:hypothetical protein